MTGLYAVAPSAPQWTASNNCSSVSSFYCLNASSIISLVSPATINRVLISSDASLIGTRTMSASGSTLNGNTTYTALLPVDATTDGASLTVTLEYAVDGMLDNVTSNASLLSFFQTVRSK